MLTFFFFWNDCCKVEKIEQEKHHTLRIPSHNVSWCDTWKIICATGYELTHYEKRETECLPAYLLQWLQQLDLNFYLTAQAKFHNFVEVLKISTSLGKKHYFTNIDF